MDSLQQTMLAVYIVAVLAIKLETNAAGIQLEHMPMA
jgi:hypothetical protein